MIKETIGDDGATVTTKTFDDVWTVVAHQRTEFIKGSFDYPTCCFVGRKQWRELHTGKSLFERGFNRDCRHAELMGMELFVVDRDDFVKVTA